MDRNARPLNEVITNLLPTPTARLGSSRGASHPDCRRELQPKRGGELDEVAVHVLLPAPSLALGTDWGIYAPAIERWENLTRPAPAPTEPGTRGNRRLAAALPEWMMGLPDGHITAVPGITRNDQIKAAGNGVVPQQVHLALRALLIALAGR
jgi:DNA (cytosine-5)-methyltransferase 1